MIKVCVIGLGYVGLPLAVAVSKKYRTIGFDINQKRIDELEEENLAILSAEEAWAGVTTSQVPDSEGAEAAAVGADSVFAPSTSQGEVTQSEELEDDKEA